MSAKKVWKIGEVKRDAEGFALETRPIAWSNAPVPAFVPTGSTRGRTAEPCIGTDPAERIGVDTVVRLDTLSDRAMKDRQTAIRIGRAEAKSLTEVAYVEDTNRRDLYGIGDNDPESWREHGFWYPMVGRDQCRNRGEKVQATIERQRQLAAAAQPWTRLANAIAYAWLPTLVGAERRASAWLAGTLEQNRRYVELRKRAPQVAPVRNGIVAYVCPLPKRLAVGERLNLKRRERTLVIGTERGWQPKAVPVHGTAVGGYVAPKAASVRLPWGQPCYFSHESDAERYAIKESSRSGNPVTWRTADGQDRVASKVAA